MEKQKNRFLAPLLTAAVIAGGAAGLAGFASAQSAPATTATTPTVTTSVQSTATTNTQADTEVADATGAGAKTETGGHMDFIVSAVNGTTLTVTEDNDARDAGVSQTATFTIDTSKASPTVTNAKVGDKIFVDGTVNGSVVSATSISTGHPGGPGGAAHEAAEAPGTENAAQ